MEVAVADEDRRPAGRDALDLVAPFARGLDRRLDGLGAGVHRQHAVLAAERGEVARERPELVVGERAARERHAVELVAGGGDEPRVAVAEVQRRVGRQRVEVAAAAVVVDPGALGARDRHRQRVVVVGGVALGDGGGVLAPEPGVERERQAARAAAGLEELRDVDDDGLQAALAQLELQARRARRHDDRAPDDDRVRAERARLLVGEHDRVRDEPLDRSQAVGVEGARRDEGGVRVERAEDDVDVVEALVGELDRQDPALDEPRELDVGRGRRARAVAGDERGAEGQRVAGALLHDVLAQAPDVEAVRAKPGLGVGGLGTALGMAHARGDERRAVDEAEVRGEDEIGEPGQRVEDVDGRSRLAQRPHERVPLALGALAIDADREVHPRVDRVGDVEVRGRAHEVVPAPGELGAHRHTVTPAGARAKTATLQPHARFRRFSGI